MRLQIAAVIILFLAVRAPAAPLPTSVEVTVEPQKFGDTSSILQVDSTVATFRFDRPVQHLALVLESRPKEPRTIRIARLSLELAKPVTEGRLCVQMADQGFIPLGNGSPNQMQLFMQVDCGGTLISSSQSFLKEKFNFSRSRARTGAGTLTRKVVENRAPVFWLMGNSDNGTYFNDDDLNKMVSKNRDAYVLIAYLEVAEEAPPEAAKPALVQVPGATTSAPVPTTITAPAVAPAAAKLTATPDPVPAVTAAAPPVVAAALVGPPFPPPLKPADEPKPLEVKPAEPAAKPKAATSSSSKTTAKPTSTKSSKTSKSTPSSSKKKKKS